MFYSYRLPIRAAMLGWLCVSVPVIADQTNPLTLDAAVAEALADNPGLAEIRARAEAMAAIPSQVSALPDPSLSFDAQNLPSNSFSLHKEDMTFLQVGFSQELPFPGKLALKEKAAEFEALAAQDSVEEARLRLARDVKLLWWQLFFRERALEIIANNEKKLRQLVDATQARYRVGNGMQQDALLAQLELSKLRDMELGHVRMHHGEITRLNALLNRPANSHLHPAIDTPAFAEIPEENALMQLAERSRPVLAQKQKLLDTARSRLELADKGYYPDFNLGAGYAARQNTSTGLSRSDFASFRLSMNLPVYAADKQAKAVDQRQSELLQEQYAWQDALRKVQAEVGVALVNYRSLREEVTLYKATILPQARQTAASLLSAYQVGQADFPNLLRAQVAVLEYETRYWQAYTQAQQAGAELIAAVGKEVLHEQ